METKVFDAKKVAEAIVMLRDAGIPEEVLAEFSVQTDGSAISQGHSQAELDSLVAQMPLGGSLKIVFWIAIHSRVDLE